MEFKYELVKSYSNDDMKTKSMLYSEANKSLRCKVLNEITYHMEMELD